MWECVPFWVDANTFTVWDWGDALPSELIKFRLLIEYVGMRSLLSRSRFICWLGMWWCVSFCVEANTLLFEIEKVRYLLSWNRFVCWLSMWGCVPFWVDANTFAVWDSGDALPSELIQFRLLIEYVGMRSLLSRSRFVCWLGMWWCVSFWVEANTLLFEIEEVRYLLSWNRFVCWLSMWGCVPFWVEAYTFAVWDWGDALPSELIQFRLLIEYVGMRSLLSRRRYVCWLSVWVYVSFWVEANTLLFEIEEVRYLLSWNRFVCSLSMWGCVPL